MVWLDLTVENAEPLKEFYAAVLGMTTEGVDMGGYEDYMLYGPNQETAVGVCHARGSNGKIPPVWMPMVVVADLDKSIETCLALGGKHVSEISSYGEGRFTHITDPQGITLALWQYD